jgi:hypothetical protein
VILSLGKNARRDANGYIVPGENPETGVKQEFSATLTGESRRTFWQSIQP